MSTHHIHHPQQPQQQLQTQQYVDNQNNNNSNLMMQHQRKRLQMLPTGEEYNCSKCGSLGCDVRIVPCGCVLHARCVPLCIFSEYRMNDVNNNNQGTAPSPPKTTLCPVCNSTALPMTAIYLFPLSFRDLEEASSLRRRCVASAAAVSAAAASDMKNKNGENSGEAAVAAAAATTDALMMEDDIHQITAAAAPYLAVSHGLSGGTHSRGGSNCNDPNPNSANSSAAACHPRRTSHHEIDRHRRTGRWTPEEMAYIDHLISAFDHGMLPLPNGIKLNEFLSDLLLCKSSRLTKKMKNAKLSTRLFDITLPEPGANGLVEEQKSPFCCGTLSRLQKLFLKSVSSEPTKLELQFNMQRMWRTHFSNLCLQIGYDSLHATDWLASLDEMEQKISTVEEMLRRARRKRMGIALQRKDSTGTMSQPQQPQPNQVTPMMNPTGASNTASTMTSSTSTLAPASSYRGPAPSTATSSANDFTVELNFDNKKSYPPPQPTENALTASPRLLSTSPRLMPSSPRLLPKSLSSSSLTGIVGQRSRFYSDDLSFSVLESLMEENAGDTNSSSNSRGTVPASAPTSAPAPASAHPPPAPSSCSSTMDGYYTEGTTGASTTSVTTSNQLLQGINNITASSPKTGDSGPFIHMVLQYMEMNHVPFEHVDVWVPSFMPTDDDNTSEENKSTSKDDDDNLRLCHAGHGTRSDILSSQTAFNLNEFGTYSSQFSFTPGVGLPGRTYASGIPTWEESIQHSDPQHFKRCGGAKIYGVKTVLGIPVPSPSIGRIVVALYSTKDVLKDVELVKRCFVEFSKYVPEPRWKLVIDIGSSAPSRPTLEPTTTVTTASQQQQQTVSNVVSANSSSSLSYGGGNDDYGSGTAGSNKRDYNQMQQQQGTTATTANATSAKLQVHEHGPTGNSTAGSSSKRIKEEETSLTNKICPTNIVTDDEELERQIAYLLGEQMPIDSYDGGHLSDSLDNSNHGNSPALSASSHASQHGNQKTSNLMSGFVQLRLLLLRPSARRSTRETEMLEILKASYRGYTNGNRRSGNELARLLVRDWMYLIGGSMSSSPSPTMTSYNAPPSPKQFASPSNPPLPPPAAHPSPAPASNASARHVHYGSSSMGTSSQSYPPSSTMTYRKPLSASSDHKSVGFGVGNSNGGGSGGDNGRNLPSPIISNGVHNSQNMAGMNASKQQQQHHHQGQQQQQTMDQSGLLRRNHISFTSTSSASLLEENNNPTPGSMMDASSSNPASSTSPNSSLPPGRSGSDGNNGSKMQHTNHDGGASVGNVNPQKPVIISET